MKDKDRPSRIGGWLNGAVYVLFAVLAAAIVISMNFEAGVLLEFFLVFVAAVIAMTLWLKRQLSTVPETGDEVGPAGAEAAALLEGARAVLRYREFEPTARAIFDTCKELTGATAGYVALISADGSENEVLFLDAGGRACHVDPDLPMPIRGLRGEAYAKGKAVYENDFGNSPWIKHIPADHVKLDNILFAPLILEEKVVGVIGLANKPGLFNENDARLAAAFGEIASIGLTNSQMLESLEKSESRFRRAVTEAPFPIMIHADDGEVLQINKVWTELTGYEPEEIPTLSAWTQRAYGERKDVVKSRIDKIFNCDTRVEEGEYVISSRDGRILTWDFSSAPLGRLPDGRRLVISIAMDVTDRKEAEEKIESLAKFPAENPNPVLRIRRDGTILYSNRAGLAMENAWGCRRGQRLEGQWREMVEKALRLGAVQRGEIKYQGQVFSLVFAPVVESDYVNIYGLDITDLHEAEAALYWESSVNKALANLSNVLNKPHYSFEEISDFVLAHAKRMTGSKFGFAGYVDEQTGYLVCPTMAKEVWKQCRMQGRGIVFKKHGGLSVRVLNEGQSILTNTPREDPRTSGTPEGHIPMERFIGVPSMAGDEVIGMVALANADRDYVERDLWLVERLAEIYALAIQSNRSQRRLEKHESQLRDLVSSLGLAQERRERKLAAGLHEEIIDRLNSARESMRSLDKVEGKERSADSMPRVREALRDLVETTHAFASELSCPVLRQSGLEAAVENWLTEDIRKKHGIETVFENDDTCSVFDEDMRHFLFEAIKELLTNTVEHARATRVKVSLKRSGDDVAVAVADDGMGFDMAGTRPKAGEGTRYNLFCIGERLRHLGGDMEIDSRLGEGTRVVMKVPAGSGVRK